eukprot:gene5660-3679_t
MAAEQLAFWYPMCTVYPGHVAVCTAFSTLYPALPDRSIHGATVTKRAFEGYLAACAPRLQPPQPREWATLDAAETMLSLRAPTVTLAAWIAADPAHHTHQLATLVARITARAKYTTAATCDEIRRAWAGHPDSTAATATMAWHFDAAGTRISNECERIFTTAMLDQYGVGGATGAAAAAALARPT